MACRIWLEWKPAENTLQPSGSSAHGDIVVAECRSTFGAAEQLQYWGSVTRIAASWPVKLASHDVTDALVDKRD